MDLTSSLDYLGSAECFDSLRKDPYWPKWNSPWWHMVLLWELGEAQKIPRASGGAMLEAMDRKWLRGYLPSELPANVNRQTDMPCFCGAGIIEQVLREAGADFDGAVPWLRGWGLKYVLPDGGVNCDEGVYLEKGSKKSSYQSTVALAEGVLSRPALTPEEVRFLDGVANYLLVRKLFRTSMGEVVDLGWLQPKFPRFYDYDTLRGLRYLARWKTRLGREVPKDAVAEALKHLPEKGPVKTEPADCITHPAHPGVGLGHGKQAEWFPLLKTAVALGTVPSGKMRDEVFAALG